MRRLRKTLILLGSCSLALFLTISRRGDDLQIGTNASLSAAVHAGSASYDLAQAQIFTKTLYYVNN